MFTGALDDEPVLEEDVGGLIVAQGGEAILLLTLVDLKDEEAIEERVDGSETKFTTDVSDVSDNISLINLHSSSLAVLRSRKLIILLMCCVYIVSSLVCLVNSCSQSIVYHCYFDIDLMCMDFQYWQACVYKE